CRVGRAVAAREVDAGPGELAEKRRAVARARIGGGGVEAERVEGDEEKVRMLRRHGGGRREGRDGARRNGNRRSFDYVRRRLRGNLRRIAAACRKQQHRSAEAAA